MLNNYHQSFRAQDADNKRKQVSDLFCICYQIPLPQCPKLLRFPECIYVVPRSLVIISWAVNSPLCFQAYALFAVWLGHTYPLQRLWQGQGPLHLFRLVCLFLSTISTSRQRPSKRNGYRCHYQHTSPFAQSKPGSWSNHGLAQQGRVREF
jgi:hypothetical protein